MGIVISLWCLSGFVMMYVPYPVFSEQERLASLPALELEGCCQLPTLDEFSDIELYAARISLWAGRPTLWLESDAGGSYPIDMQSSEYIYEATQDLADQQAGQYAAKIGANSEFLGLVARDQWTITGYDFDSPFFKYRLDDASRTEIYLSSVSGLIIQQTTAFERGWNMVGAVVHWLYPSFIRQHQSFWYWTIVVFSLIGAFLALTGIYIAIAYCRWRGNGPISPFRGWGYWHHIAGLIFGIFTLTWLVSGTLSLNPSGVFDSRSLFYERNAVAQAELIFDEALRDNIRQIVSAELPVGTVEVELKMIAGELAAFAKDAQGQSQRYRALDWQPEALDRNYFATIGQRIKPEVLIRSEQWLSQHDNYYYSMDTNLSLPVYRVIYEDGERAYFDGVSGDLTSFFDSALIDRRWYFTGLHSIDFAPWLRARPVWDFVVLFLMAGVTFGALTGTWLGWKVLTRSLFRR